MTKLALQCTLKKKKKLYSLNQNISQRKLKAKKKKKNQAKLKKLNSNKPLAP